jgi:hypothetical protein
VRGGGGGWGPGKGIQHSVPLFLSHRGRGKPAQVTPVHLFVVVPRYRCVQTTTIPSPPPTVVQVLRGPDVLCESLRLKERTEEREALDRLVALEQADYEASAANRARVQAIKNLYVVHLCTLLDACTS